MKVTLGKHLDQENFNPDHFGKTTMGQLTTGPRGFLGWFGTFLGVVNREDSQVRVEAYHHALKSIEGGFYLESFRQDPIGVAERLLALRDQIILSAPRSFSLKEFETHEARLKTLVAIERAFIERSPPSGEGERLQAILDHLRMGIRQPVTHIELVEDIPSWPVLWQELFQELKDRGLMIQLRPARSGNTPDNALKKRLSLGYESCVHLRASFVTEAADAVAAYLKLESKNPVVVIRGCESRSLDQGLERLGMPALGHHETTSPHPVCSILPLVLELSWAPVNPNTLRELLHIEPNPLPRGIRRTISRTLETSPAWSLDHASKTLTAYQQHLEEQLGDKVPDHSPETNAEIFSWLWFADQRSPDSPSRERLRDNLSRIVTFADRAQKRPDLSEQTRIGLSVLRRDTEALMQVILNQDIDHYKLPMLQTFLAKITTGGHLRMEREASPHHAVDHPSGLLGPVDTVIYWMGVQSSAPRSEVSLLTGREHQDLAKAGVRFLPAAQVLEEHAAAVRQSLLLSRQRFILVTAEHIGTEPEEPLPLWYEVEQATPGIRTIGVREFMNTVYRQKGGTLTPTVTREFPDHQPVWKLTGQKLDLREVESPSSLEKLLGCPLNWVLTHQAKLKDEPGSAISMDARLAGTIAHRVFQRFFESGLHVKTPAKQKDALGQLYESVIAEEGGIYTLNGHEAERLNTKTKIIEGAITLADTLHRSGWEYESSESEVEESTPVGTIKGCIDLVVKSIQKPSVKAIIDMKWGSKDNRQKDLRQGWATQLATYSRLLGRGKTWPKTAYYIIGSSTMVTVHPDLFNGADTIQGADEKTVWTNMETELTRIRKDLSTGKVEVGQPPIRGSGQGQASRPFPAPCKYCSFGLYCQTPGRDDL